MRGCCASRAHPAGLSHKRARFSGALRAACSSLQSVARFARALHAACSSSRVDTQTRSFRRGNARGTLGTQGPCNSTLILQGRCRVCCARPPYAGPAARFAGECQAGSRFPTHPAGALHDSAQNAWACRVSAATTLRNEFSAARFPFAMQSPCVLSRRRIAGQTGGGAYAGVRPLSRGAGPAPLDARVRAPASRSRPPPAPDKTPLRTCTRTPCGLMGCATPRGVGTCGAEFGAARGLCPAGACLPHAGRLRSTNNCGRQHRPTRARRERSLPTKRAHREAPDTPFEEECQRGPIRPSPPSRPRCAPVRPAAQA